MVITTIFSERLFFSKGVGYWLVFVKWLLRQSMVAGNKHAAREPTSRNVEQSKFLSSGRHSSQI